jgi:hypothetical protein
LTAKSRTITPEDEVAIRAIEWLTFDPDQRIDALIHANALARKFVGTSIPALLVSFSPPSSSSLLLRVMALVIPNVLLHVAAADKEGALDRLLKALPRDSVGVVKRRWSVKKLAGEENVVREFACYEYLHRARTGTSFLLRLSIAFLLNRHHPPPPPPISVQRMGHARSSAPQGARRTTAGLCPCLYPNRLR